MESHVLNTYHQARYRTIGHKRMGSTSESLSSESSNQSPEYSAQQPEYAHNDYESNEGEYWTQNHNTTQTSQETSSDEEENVEVVDVESCTLDDNGDDTLVEGDDYDVIQVYTVHPDLDLEASSDEDYAINPDQPSEDEEYDQDPQNYREETQYEYQENRTDTCPVGLDIIDGPVVSNVDEYFIKEKPKPTLDIKDIKDEPVVKDVDEYFIKETPVPVIPDVPNVDDFFIKEKHEVVESKFDVVQSIPQKPVVTADAKVREERIPESEVPIAEVSINESDLDVLPNIEDIKRYLLEDISYTKFKNTHRSFSVPHSPMHHLACLDIDDAKTCLSFEDLNLDLSDLAFDNDKDKSDSVNKSDDLPRTLTDEDVNSFLITNKCEKIEKNDDDFSTQDMEIDNPVETSIVAEEPVRTSTPIPKPNVLDFCIEKAVKLEVSDVKGESDDFVDVESCNDVVIPVLVANNLSSLLEEFEATEKFSTKPKRLKEEPKVKNGLTNGMRLQDAGVQLSKNKMRQILMPQGAGAGARSPSPLRSDHDYCSPRRPLKGGQSLLKPEVLSSNSRILNSRHRSCKNKKIVYHLSSDEESDKCPKTLPRASEDSDVKAKKSTLKQPIKPPTPSNCRKKLSPSANDCKINNSVMVKNASKASDTLGSQTNTSIKLTIKNKSEVILNNCDDKAYRPDVKDIEKCTSSVSDKVNTETVKVIQELDSAKDKYVNSSEVSSIKEVKEEPHPKEENFYTALFSNKQDVQLPQSMDVKSEKRPVEDEIKVIVDNGIKTEAEQPQKKKKLNLQEYKMRSSVASNNSSAAVSPEAIFPDLPNPCLLEKTTNSCVNITPPNGAVGSNEEKSLEAPKKIFDPIREASRKILMNKKKHKAEAMRKRDEDIVMSKIPKVENLQLQPLISDAEMLKIVGSMAPEEVPAAMKAEKPVADKPKVEKPKVTDYEELVLVSVGTNTDEAVFRQLLKAMQKEVRKSISPPIDAKALINFKIKKSEPVLKQNVFEAMRKRSPDDKRPAEAKIDKERYKDITAALKSVEKQVVKKSNSLFASIQDVVLKKAPEKTVEKPNQTSKQIQTYKTVIVREYDANAEHGEDKIILHLGKHRRKPESANVVVQTEKETRVQLVKRVVKEKSPVQRKRNDSDMSMSSEGSPVRNSSKSESVEDPNLNKSKESTRKRSRSVEKRSRSKEKRPRSNEKRSRSRDKRSRSRERYDRYRRRSRSRRRWRSRSRSVRGRRSRSIDRYRRRRNSPYKNRRTRSPYRRRSPSPRRDYRSNRSISRSRSRHDSARSKSPKKTPPRTEKKCDKSFTPPLRKPTISESSDSSTSSSSSSSSSSSGSSTRSPPASPRRDEPYRRKGYRSFSPEERDSNKPVEERRIVFVGKLEKDSTKASLRSTFSKFGHIIEVRLHNKEDGTRYGFVTFERGRDAWSAVEAASTMPQYDVGFGGRRAFCRQSYADLDGLEAEYTESAFHSGAAPPRRDAMSFEQMLLDVKKKLSQRKKDEDKP